MDIRVERARRALLEKLRDWPLDSEQRQSIEKNIASCNDVDKLREFLGSLEEAEEALDAVFDHLDEMEAGE